MRPSIALDPAIFAFPTISKSEDEVAESIGLLATISEKLRESSGIRYYLMADICDYLAAADVFPIAESITEMLTRNNLRHVYTPEDVRRAVNDILAKALHLESLSGVEFMVPTSVTTSPQIVESRNGPLRESLELTLMHVILIASKTDFRLLRVVVADNLSTRQVQVTASIEDIDPPLPPDGITSVDNLRALTWTTADIESFERDCPPDVVWRHADDSSDIAVAIKLAAHAIRRAAGCPSPEGNCYDFSVGAGFYDSLVAGEAASDGKHASSTLDACARVVARLPKNEIDKLFKKTGAKGKREYVVRASDKAEACRTHITKHHEAMRLMFWTTGENSIELANIGVKSEHEIFD